MNEIIFYSSSYAAIGAFIGWIYAKRIEPTTNYFSKDTILAIVIWPFTLVFMLVFMVAYGITLLIDKFRNAKW